MNQQAIASCIALVQQTLPSLTSDELGQARMMCEANESPVFIVRTLLQHRLLERHSDWSDTLGQSD